MQFIPLANRDTRYGIWYIRYPVKVPYIQTLDVETLIEDGLPTSGDKHHDHAMQWEPRLLSIPIHRMAELWSNGANVSLVKRSDAPLIYKAITDHLMAWKNHIETSYHPSKPPYEDLLILDQFANIIYEHAKFAYDRTFVEKHFKISSASAVGRRAMLNAMTKLDDRRQENAAKGVLEVKHMDFREAVPKYNPDAQTAFIDYSGKAKQIDAPNRASLASFFKKGK